MSPPVLVERLRLDKWLWASRFFKTRQLAAEAINGGKVQLNGQRTKPGKEVRIGSRLRIHKGSLEWEVIVKTLPKQRRPASEAIHFYEEDEASKKRRAEVMAERSRLHLTSSQRHPGRPTKRERRLIEKFTGKER